MKVWEIIGLILSLLFIVFNRKIRLWKIFVEQFKVYKNDKTQKTSCFDIVSFIVSPIVLSVLIARLLPYKDVVESSGTIITVFSIIATLLLSFLALLVDKSTSNQKEKDVKSV